MLADVTRTCDESATRPAILAPLTRRGFSLELVGHDVVGERMRNYPSNTRTRYMVIAHYIDRLADLWRLLII